MDIEEEKEKIRFQNKFEMKKLFIDKLLFSILIIIAGFVVNIVIENYRNHLTTQRFLLEQKFMAVNDVRKSFDNMHRVIMEYSRHDPLRTLPDNFSVKLEEAVQNYITIGNGWGVVFTPKFNKALENYLWIYRALNKTDPSKNVVYRDFLVDLHKSFNSDCRKEIDVITEKDEAVFEFKELSFSEVSEKGLGYFFDINYNQWKNLKRKTPNKEVPLGQ